MMVINQFGNNRIFVDLDGVIFDFESHYKELFGTNCNDIDDDELWKNIGDFGTFDFFFTMNLFDDAYDFVRALDSIGEVIFLTACPKSNFKAAADAKKSAIFHNFGPEYLTIPVHGGKNKFNYIQRKGDILIDDLEKCVDPWNANGGRGILHKNFKKSLRTVIEYVNPFLEIIK